MLQTGSVTEAGRQVGLSQPAASQALARLRVLFADPLFVRHRAGLVPTARAESLRAPIASALEAIRGSITGGPPFVPKDSERRFTVWMADLGEFLALPRLAAYLAARAPHLTVAALPGGGENVESMLADGTLDLAIGPGRPSEPSIHAEPVYEETFVCVVRQGHPVLQGDWDLDRYCAERHLLVAPRGASTSAVDTWLASKGRSRRVALNVAHFLVAPHIVAASDLVWTAPAGVTRRFSKLLGLRALPTPVTMKGFTGMMKWHARQHEDEGHVWFRTAVRRAFRSAGRPSRGNPTRA